MSIGDISFPSIFDTSLAAELPDVSPVTAITSNLDSKTSGDLLDTPRRKTPPAEDVSGEKAGLDRLNADLKAQAAPTLSSDVGNGLSSLLKDLTSGNTTAAMADIKTVQADLLTQDASSVAGAKSGGPLDTLIGKISDSLNSGSFDGTLKDGAEHDLAKFLVEDGKGTGSLINTTG
jgi:hypothetical protein